MNQTTKHRFLFGPFQLDVSEQRLICNHQMINLTPKLFEVLLLLVKNQGHTLSKEELLQEIWADTFVEEGVLNRNISTLRKILGDSPKETRYIKTIHKRGYCFIASVKELREFDSPTQAPTQNLVLPPFSQVELTGGEVDLIIGRHTRSQIITEDDITSADDETHDTNHSGYFSEFPNHSKLLGTFLQFSSPKSGFFFFGVSVLCLMFGLGVAWHRPWLSTSRMDTTGSSIKTLAVLPFKIQCDKESDAYFGEGLTDSIITQLSHLKTIKIRPTSSVLKYSTSGLNSLRAQSELEVDAVLLGSVQRSGGLYQVDVELRQNNQPLPLWKKGFQTSANNLIAVQNSISEQVAHALLLQLTNQEVTVKARQSTSNSAAYQFYLKGRYFWNQRSTEGFQKASEFFKLAIEQDPNFALAYAGLADCYVLFPTYALQSADEAMPKARINALKALELDEKLGEAHTCLAMIKESFDFDLSGAEKEYQQAIELNPNYATAHHWYGNFLICLERFDEAEIELRQALEIDPLSGSINSAYGALFYYKRDYPKAIEQFQKTLEMYPNAAGIHAHLGLAYQQKGLYQPAIEEFQTAISLSGSQNPGHLLRLGRVYAISGKTQESLKLFEKIKKQFPIPSIPAEYLVMYYAGLGDREQTFQYLEEAYSKRGSSLLLLKVDPVFDNFRSDPRFLDLLHRLGLDGNR